MEDLFFKPNKGKVLGLVRRPDQVVGDNDVGNTLGWIDPPTFCNGSTEDEINAAHEGRSQYGDNWNLDRHKGAKNPMQCETARQYDLATDRWYRESPASLLKNLGAGIINGIVPGSDLGDAGSSTQIFGQLIGGFGSIFINPGAIATTISNSMGLGSTLGKAINFVNKTLSGPIGTIAGNVVSSMFASPAPVQQQVQQQMYSAPQPANITEQAMSYAQKQIFGSTAGNLQVKTGVGSLSTGSTTPVWIYVVAVLSFTLTVLGFIFMTKKGKR